MIRILALPFTILLGVVSFLILMGGAALLEETTEGESDRGALSWLFGDGDAARAERENAMGIGLTLVVVGLLGMIAAVALTVAALTGGDGAQAVAPQQQQQQVVVVTDGDSQVRTG